MSGMRPFQEAVAADPALAYRIRDFLATGNPRLAYLPDPGVQATPEPPAAEVQAGEPGPADADGTVPAGPEAEAGPGEAQDPAPGAPLEDTDPAAPPAGDEPPAEAPGAEHGANAQPAGTVTPEEVEAEFGDAPAPADDGAAAGQAPETGS